MVASSRQLSDVSGGSSARGLTAQTLRASAFDPRIQPQCSLAVQLRRVTGAIVGRSLEIAAIQQQLGDAQSRLSAVTLEGEPGIGKTRLLLAAAELATASGFTSVAVTADEEIRGPFLLAQSIFAAPALRDAIVDTAAEALVRRAVDAVSGRDEPGLEALSPDAKLLRAFDVSAVAVGAVAAQKPLAVLIDDVQWADDDTLRMLRYIVRADADRPIFLLLTVRPDEFSEVTEAVHFVADMERMGLVRRLRPGRLGRGETAELLNQMLGGPVDPVSAEAMHAQSEGVPFVLDELVRAYRDAGMIQPIDGVWALGRNAARLVPSAVRTLIQRRAARLPSETRSVLGDAAVLGRSFSLRDLQAIASRLDGEEPPEGALADALRPAVEAGLLLQQAEGAPADYTFTHGQVRDFALAELPQARSRAAHRAVVDLLLEAGDPAPASLPLLAHHALAGGDTERAARFSIDAAQAALQANAPEEALRLVEQALPTVTTSQDRRLLLTVRDDAHAMQRRPAERLEGLAELAALAEALRDTRLELDVQLRRAAALRLSHDEEAAADLARRVRTRAADEGDAATELRANLELGQAILRCTFGESFGPVANEVDLNAAEEAYQRAATIAESLGDDRSLAAALRELGVILVGRVRHWFAEQILAGRALEITQRAAAGEPIEAIMQSFPVYPMAVEAMGLFERALGIYERLDDRTGVMSTIIAMAYINYAPVTHIASSARHLEEIRRVTSRLSALVTESERARQELQMLYGVHVFARAKVVPDLMLSRGTEAYRSAKLLGDRLVEFLSAGGVAMAHVELGELEEAEQWLRRASAAAAAAPTPMRARQLEMWRGALDAARGDAGGMREHLELAVKLATDQGRPAARCEALAQLALEAARLGATIHDPELLDLAEGSAAEAQELNAVLSGHPPWGALASAAIAQVALARGEFERAAAAGGAALQALQRALFEDANLEIVLPASRAILAAGPSDALTMVRALLKATLSRIVQGTADEDMRVRWLRGPVGRELATLAGPIEAPVPSHETAAPDAVDRFDESDRRLLQLLTEGSTNREMADDVRLPEEEIVQRLARLLTRIGASTRAEATSLAFRSMAH
jgi:tetratricopeptide (TPR) repeat protein